MVPLSMTWRGWSPRQGTRLIFVADRVALSSSDHPILAVLKISMPASSSLSRSRPEEEDGLVRTFRSSHAGAVRVSYSIGGLVTGVFRQLTHASNADVSTMSPTLRALLIRSIVADLRA